MRKFTEVDDARFGQETLNILINLRNQFFTVLRYSLRGGQIELRPIMTRFVVSFVPFITKYKNVKVLYRINIILFCF